jgi:hypothetical protein
MVAHYGCKSSRGKRAKTTLAHHPAQLIQLLDEQHMGR